METNQTPNPPPGSPSLGSLERVMTWLYDIRLWFTTAARVGQLMARGAYLIGERRRLFVKLGEMVYEKNQSRSTGDAASINAAATDDFENTSQLVHQIDRLTKKLEIEEMLIRSVRFGVKAERPHRAAADDDGKTNGNHA